MKDGVVTDPASGKSVSYGELRQGKRIERQMEKVPLKPVTSYKVIGNSARRKDAAVIGHRKSQVHCRFRPARNGLCPHPAPAGARRNAYNIDTSAAEKVPGVKIMKDGDMIAVVADRPDKAEKALALIKAQFEPIAATRDNKSIFDHLLRLPWTRR